MKKEPFIIILLLLLWTNCYEKHKEIGRTSNKQNSSEENLFVKNVSTWLKKGDVVYVCFEMDIEYIYEPDLRFVIKVLKGDKEISRLEPNPRLGILSKTEKKSIAMDTINWKFNSNHYRININESGKYNFENIFVVGTASYVKIKKADLVYKK